VAANAAISLAELGELVKATVGRSPGLTVEDRIAAAAKTLRLAFHRTRHWYYGGVRRVEAWEADTIRQNALRARENEILRMERRLEAMRAELAQMAPLDGIRPAVATARGRRHRGQRKRAQAS